MVSSQSPLTLSGVNFVIEHVFRKGTWDPKVFLLPTNPQSNLSCIELICPNLHPYFRDPDRTG